jgi:hypothetical protein
MFTNGMVKVISFSRSQSDHIKRHLDIFQNISISVLNAPPRKGPHLEAVPKGLVSAAPVSFIKYLIFNLMSI